MLISRRRVAQDTGATHLVEVDVGMARVGAGLAESKLEPAPRSSYLYFVALTHAAGPSRQEGIPHMIGQISGIGGMPALSRRISHVSVCYLSTLLDLRTEHH